MRILRDICLSLFFLGLGALAGVAVNDNVIVHDDAVLLIAACPNPPRMVWVRSDGTIELGTVPLRDSLDVAGVVARINKIPESRRIVFQYPCPAPVTRPQVY